jgi:ACS family hexuronate transporter-like MFS transporter
LVGKMLTDPVWWFYLTWLPLYLKRERDVTLTSAAGALAAIYLAADFGSILGGWFPGFLVRRGVAPGRARILTMLVCALGLPISACAVLADSLWTAVALISLATASHQAWSANMFTVASDAFPRRFVASVVGFGAMCGGIGGMFMNIVSGGMLQWLGSYAPLFVFAGVMHPLAWIAIRLLSGKSIREVNLETDLRTSFSPQLLGLGIGFSLAGIAAAGTVILNYDYVLSVTKNSGAAAAGGIAAGGILVIMGMALIYACRRQRVGVVEGGPSIIAH